MSLVAHTWPLNSFSRPFRKVVHLTNLHLICVDLLRQQGIIIGINIGETFLCQLDQHIEEELTMQIFFEQNKAASKIPRAIYMRKLWHFIPLSNNV